MVLTGLTKYRELGLLLLRVGLGVAFMCHGFPRLIAGAGEWRDMGSDVGLPAPAVFGFIAALSMTVGGLLLLLGLYFRVACILLAGTMLGALIYHVRDRDSFREYAHALESLIVFAALIFIGPGKHSVDKK
jgi:putative oxidoreductase